MSTLLLAMDRATVRRRDANGFLHVAASNISKANVCPYFGREIPNWQALGLDAAKVYHLYRDPAELARGAATFNNVPLLSKHLPVMPEQLPEELIIGSTGTDCAFDGAYLANSLVVWSAPYQRAIEGHRQKQLSCGYRYRADMTPGSTPEGLKYDGVMRDIIGNHVALVIEGRAGPDVVIGDEVMKLTSRTALMISGALSAFVRPKLANDAKVDIAPALSGIDAKSFAMDGAPKKVANKVVELATPHLAQDQTLDVEGLTNFIAAIPPIAADEDMIGEPSRKDGEGDRTRTEVDTRAEDKAVTAMDQATVSRMIAEAEARGAASVAAIEIARRDVQPLVGEVIGMDSAAAVYTFALDSAGYDKATLKDVPAATLKAMVAREVERAKSPAPLALDAAATAHRDDFSKRFPNAAKLKRI